MRESKECLECGGVYFRPENYVQAQWDARRYCSQPCTGAALRRRASEAKAEREQEAERLKAAAEATTQLPGPEHVLALAEPTSQISSPRGIERELRVIRVGPNPKLIVCEYYELSSRRTCKVLVKRITKWVKGMSFKMTEPSDELAYNQPWPYLGKAPRWRGRF